MNILYGIQGTGNGHLTRSMKVIGRLKEKGHEVDVVLSGNYGNIQAPHPIRYQLKGFTFQHHADGSVDIFRTFLSLDFRQFLKDTKLDLDRYDRIITDYDPITAWAAKWQDKESYGLSNQYAFLSDKTPRPRPRKKDPVSEFILKNFAPVTHPIGMHFKEYDTFIYKPVIRDDVRALTLTDEGHYTVYVPDVDMAALVDTLNTQASGERFEVFTNKVKAEETKGNCRIRPTHPEHFMQSFASAHGIITRCGFQTTAEALYTGKKLMAVPQLGQYEQACNAVSLAELGAYVGPLEEVGSYLTAPTPAPQPWEDPVERILERMGC